MKEKVAAELKNNFRPEFLNRIDATVVFRSLTVEEITQIVDLMLARVRDQLRAQQMQLEVTQAAKEHIIKLGYDVAYGARPLRRVIQNMVEDVLAEHLLLGKYEPGTTIVVDKRPGGRPRHPRRRDADPGRSRLIAGRRPASGVTQAAGQAPEPLRLPVVRRGVPPLGGPVPRLLARGTASSRPWSASRAAAAPSARRRGRGSPRRRRRSAIVARAATCRAARSGSASSTASSAAGSSPGSIVLVGGEPGIGKSTLLLQAAAGIARRAARRVLYATGEESAAQVRLRADRLGLLDGPGRDGDPGRRRVGDRPDRGARPRPSRPTLLIVDSIQTATVDELDGPAGSVGQVRGVGAPPDGAGEVGVDRRRPRRPRDEGRLARRAEDARAPRRRGPGPRGRALRGAPARPGLEEPVRVDRGGRRVRDGRRRAWPRSTIRRGRSSPSTTAAGARQRRRPDARGQPADPRRGPGARRAGARSGRRGGRRAASTPTGSRCSSPSSAGGRGSAWRATTSTSTSPAACRSTSRRSTCRSRSPSRRRSATGRSRPGPSRSARWACSASCAGRRASSGGCARRPGSGSRGRSCPRARGPAGSAATPVDGLEVVRGRHACARRSRRRSDPAGRTRGGGLGAMLGWRPRRTPRRGGRSATGGTTRANRDPQHPPARHRARRPVGLALARPAGLLVVDPTGGVQVTPSGGVFLDRLDRRLDGRRVRDPAVPDDRAGALAATARSSSSRPPSSSRPSSGCCSGLLMGLLLGLPLSQLEGPAGTWLPLGVSLFLGLGMVGLTVAKREDLLLAAEAIGLVRRPAPATARATRRRSPHRRRHERDHRRPDQGHRRVRLHLRHARRPEVRPRGAPAHRRQLRHAPPQPRPARARHPRPDAEGVVDAGRDRRRRRARDRRGRREARRPRPGPEQGDPDERLQPEPRRRAPGHPGPEHQLARERREAGRPAGRGAPGPGHPGGQGGRARASASSTTAR